MVPIAGFPNLLAVGIEFQDNAGLPVHIEHVVLVVETDAMRIEKNPFAPGLEKVPVSIKN
jgi:hypothetical protein